MPQESLQSPALVVGFAIHGLAVARALARSGVHVHALSDSSMAEHPTARTSYARMHFRPSLNSGPIAQYLLELADVIGSPHKIVLFPTSDRIAQGISAAWDSLSERYLLSWAHCRNLVMQLQHKDSLTEHCERAGVRYPRSRVLHTVDGAGAIAKELRFPLAVKPARPLSSFKAIRAESPAELERCAREYASDLPFVVQEWIDGPEPSLYACTSYLVHGSPVYLFTSRKIAASPPGTGQGTVFQTLEDEQVKQIAAQFLRMLDLSGPAAVEFKRDANGVFWFIEPNVGRTEYCVDLAVQGGFNLPLIEYLHATGGDWRRALPDHVSPCAWFDTDKDPACFVRNLHALGGDGARRRAVFPYVGHEDWRPFVTSLHRQVGWPFGAVRRRLVRAFRRAPAH